MVKNKENPTTTENGSEGDKKVIVDKKVPENDENNAEPELVNKASEKSDEPMAVAEDAAANGVENEETPGEKSEGKKDQNDKRKGKLKNKRLRNKKKKKNQAAKTTEDKQSEEKKTEDKKPEASNGAKGDMAGLIFMCSSKTKQDCFRYHVFGLPKSQKDVVEKVAKGMKLFLYDYELRLMYGIYKAKARGGLNIERNAFRTAERPFPAQVRFAIHKDCLPLPEDKFKVAIKDNYYGKNKKKFKFELNGKQVKTLCRLFQPIRRDGVIPSLHKDERRAPFENVHNFHRPNLSIPPREIASLYPPLSQDPYALRVTDLYHSAYPTQPLPPYEPQRELLYGRHERERMLEDSTYLDRLRRERILEDSAFLNGTTRGIVPREPDYGDAYLRRDLVGRPDIYPYASGSSSVYRY